MAILELENISFHYERSKKNVLENINLEFEEGKIYSVVGRSGAGKTTLLSLLSGLAKPTDGKIIYNGKDIKEADKYEYRSRNIGVVFQNYNLLPNLTALENVILSMDISGKRIENKKEKALGLLEKVGLDADEANRRVLKLSGGQQQRVAIARAISYDPDIIFADEPTGNLDTQTQNDIMDIFRNLAHLEAKCIVIVTHSPEVAKASDFVYELKKSK